jgi:hypothetical protein
MIEIIKWLKIANKVAIAEKVAINWTHLCFLTQRGFSANVRNFCRMCEFMSIDIGALDESNYIEQLQQERTKQKKAVLRIAWKLGIKPMALYRMCRIWSVSISNFIKLYKVYHDAVRISRKNVGGGGEENKEEIKKD